MAPVTELAPVDAKTAAVQRLFRRTAAVPWLRTVVRRIALAVPQLFIVSSLTFLLSSFREGDLGREILGFQASAREVKRLDLRLGVHLPVWDQYWRWLVGVLHGNFGQSIVSDQAVSQAIGQRLPVTLALVLAAVFVTTVVGVTIGVLTSVRGGVAAEVVDSVALVGFSLPAFWLASGLIVIFAVKLRLLPAIGYVSFGQSPLGWAKSLTLPVAALAIGGAALVARQTREAMSGVMESEYVRMARAHGVRPLSLILRYGLRNAAIPIVTLIGVQFIWLLAGTVFVEEVFALPGLGSLMIRAALAHDVPVVQGVTVTFTVLVILVNLLVDLAYTWLNPKVRTR